MSHALASQQSAIDWGVKGIEDAGAFVLAAASFACHDNRRRRLRLRSYSADVAGQVKPCLVFRSGLAFVVIGDFPLGYCPC